MLLSRIACSYEYFIAKAYVIIRKASGEMWHRSNQVFSATLASWICFFVQRWNVPNVPRDATVISVIERLCFLQYRELDIEPISRNHSKVTSRVANFFPRRNKCKPFSMASDFNVTMNKQLNQIFTRLTTMSFARIHHKSVTNHKRHLLQACRTL